MTEQNGRPRDTRIDSAVLSAAAELLTEVGYADLTMAAIADRAGTSRPAVYRRWPSKAHLVHEAVFREADTSAVAATGALETDLRAVVTRTVALLTSPLARLAVPGLIGEAAADATLNQRLLDRFAVQGWRGLDGHLAAAIERGELRPGFDGGVLLEVVIGAALAALLIRGPDGLTDAWVHSTTRLLLDGLRAP
ncbi:TetR/AcrR family transcriptional regulator [Nocardia asteroides]|uniref:TetR/AcrR family transcriptional regulator n=1 Tax=Nocardia asteroides TaxID=1824 RepID=UPI001E637324|nr:TetR/AcrR family transcriptional regulator [Nocardia asteroides]UGT61706.1 TetR/AcrR family transcriptional regulator [Nocardia asteroides]